MRILSICSQLTGQDEGSIVTAYTVIESKVRGFPGYVTLQGAAVVPARDPRVLSPLLHGFYV